MLRQQRVKADDKPQYSLADFVAPRESGLLDHVGAFAVTAGLGAEEIARDYEAEHDDYSAIMVKAIADRLAEAFAEMLHARVRREWGYGADENLSPEDLVAERYRGIRPAFGYPACPDHQPKRRLFDLLDAPAIGMSLSESLAMLPAASVSGIYIQHPQARYFAVGPVTRDQVEDYAARMGQSVEEAERWLSPNLAYDPKTVGRSRPRFRTAPWRGRGGPAARPARAPRASAPPWRPAGRRARASRPPTGPTARPRGRPAGSPGPPRGGPRPRGRCRRSPRRTSSSGSSR